MKSQILPGRLGREYRTIATMLPIYCRDHCGPVTRELGMCASCRELLDYAEMRLDRCPYGQQKPVCNECPVHCYKPEPKEQIKKVMRYAGPRMLLRHPYLAVMHLLDVRKRFPDQPPMCSNRQQRKPSKK